jgi:L-ascorbate metabolism protein UlaG (beta-lactamase superfamily)
MMMKNMPIFLLSIIRSASKPVVIILLISMLSACQSTLKDRSTLEVTYIANEGFLIRSGSKTVLIDALFNDSSIDFCDTPPSGVLGKMERAQDPFHALDLVLVTHVHADHFAAAPVAEHLLNNPQCILVCPDQVAEKLKQECSCFEEISPRVRAVSLQLNASSEFHLNGIRVQAYRMKHCRYMEEDALTGERHDRHADIENLVYLVDMGGRSFLHMGDAVLEQNSEYIQSLDLVDQHITLAFLEFFDGTPASKKIMDENIKPSQIVFMHLPFDENMVNKITDTLKQEFASAIVFDNSMEKVTIQ